MNFFTFECFSVNIGLTAVAIIYCNTRVDYTADETLHNVIFERRYITKFTPNYYTSRVVHILSV